MLVRFNPLSELDNLSEQFRSLSSINNSARIPVDAYKKDSEYVINFDLPGIEPKDIELSVEKNVLTLEAQRIIDFPEGADIALSERRYGKFTRKLVLGDGLNTEQIKATSKNGVLSVTIPIAEQAKVRKIEINSTDEREISQTVEASTTK